MWNHCFVVVVLIFTCFTDCAFSFWFLSQVQVSAVGGASNPALCDLIPGMSRRQRKLCQRFPDVMASIAEGAKLGISQCQNQFATERWNCTTIDRSGFGKIVVKLGSREAAFVYAISSAGVVQSIAKACSRGEVMSCSCDPARTGRDLDKAGDMFTWGGCSDNVNYASNFARRFIDAKEKKSRDGRALMNLHNNRAGRKVVKKKMRLQCKCHGVSGSCTTKTCWKAVGNFDTVGKMLHHRYRQAMQVSVGGQGAGLVANSHGLRYDSPLPKDERHRAKSRTRAAHRRKQDKDRVKRSDLVFFEPSPDYCVTDPRTGSLGTAGRRCNKTSNGPDSCDLLCCGRGYDTKRIVREEKCQCKFIWCCKVVCKTCRIKEDIHTCKSPQILPPESARFQFKRRKLEFQHSQLPTSTKPSKVSKMDKKTSKPSQQRLTSRQHHFRSPKLRSKDDLRI